MGLQIVVRELGSLHPCKRKKHLHDSLRLPYRYATHINRPKSRAIEKLPIGVIYHVLSKINTSPFRPQGLFGNLHRVGMLEMR